MRFIYIKLVFIQDVSSRESRPQEAARRWRRTDARQVLCAQPLGWSQRHFRGLESNIPSKAAVCSQRGCALREGPEKQIQTWEVWSAGQAQNEGQRQRAPPDAQPELGSGRAEKHPAGTARRHEADQDRDSSLRPQLHLGSDRDPADGRSARTSCRPSASRMRAEQPGKCFVRRVDLCVTCRVWLRDFRWLWPKFQSKIGSGGWRQWFLRRSVECYPLPLLLEVIRCWKRP